VAGVQFLIDAAKGFIIDKGAQQLVVTAAPFVGTGENRIDDTQPAGCTEPLRSQPFTRWHKSIKIAAVCSSVRTIVVPIAMIRPRDA
jgi:hypothetical protein